MNDYGQNLHLDDVVFERMRNDADNVLQKLIKNMVEKDSLDGKLTITIDVSLEQEFIENSDPAIDGETRKTLTPKFTHKVSSVMQVKNESKGNTRYDGVELVWDDEAKEYVLKHIANAGQMTIFDADFKCVNDPEGNEEHEEDEQLALEGRKVAALIGSNDGGNESVETTYSDGEKENEETFSLSEDENGYDYEEPAGGNE